jgi:hypothetical protein
MKLFTEEAQDVKMLTESVNGKKKLYIEGVFCEAETKNRNGRVYPFQTLNNAINFYVENFVNKKRAVGELGHPCLSGDAKLLSVGGGWKHIKDCEDGELVYTLNPDTKEVEVHPVDKVVITQHKGIMYNLKNRGINTKITPDHRFLIYNSRNKSQYKFVTAQEIFEDLNGNNSLSKWFIPKASLGITQTNSPDEYIISKSSTIKVIVEKTKKYLNDLHIEFKTFSAFMGIYLSEGCCTKQLNNSYSIGIFQNAGHKADRISEILYSMAGLEWYESTCDGKTIWTCYDRRLGEYLFDFGNCYEKYIPRDFIASLDSETARIFIEYFVLGDGRGKLQESYSRCDAFSTSKRLIDDIAQVATVAGFGVSLYQEICGEDYVFAGRIIKAENKSPLYFCTFLTTQGVYLDNRFMQMEQEEWDDYVYCIQVKNTNFMVEQNGYTYWTGNCSPAINYERVSHIIESITRKGNCFYGRASITNTPMGNIVKNLHDEGVVFGVSSRAVGSLRATNEGVNIVGDDLMFSTVADIVHDPSCTSAFVEGIMEGREWYYDVTKNEWLIEDTKKKINKLVESRQLEGKKLELFNNFINSI